DDDDDRCLLDIIGDPQALNYFLHGPSNKTQLDEDELTNAGYSSANSNSIFANSTNTDPSSSIKDVNNHLGEASGDGLQLPNSLQFLEDELDAASPLPELSEDQPFDILQKSLQEANITEQTLAEEAYLDASIGSNQQFTQTSLHPSSSASFTQASDASSYSGQTLHPIGVAQVPIVQQTAGTPFANHAVSVQHGFMQQVGVNNIANQHLSNSNSVGGPGQIQLVGSFNSQPSMMAINNLDGSHIIVKGNVQHPSSGMSGGLMLQRQTPNGNSLYGSSNPSSVTQPVNVPFSSSNFQTPLPIPNIIIQRSQAPNQNKMPINIQPKPIQMGHHTVYNVNNMGMQQHHVQQGVPYASTNSPQSSAVGPQMAVNIVNQHGTRKSVGPQVINHSGNSIVVHSPAGQHQLSTHQNQFFIPTTLSVNSNSVHHVQTLNGQILQSQPTHLVASQVSSEHIMMNRNSAGTVMANQSYSGQMLSNQNNAMQLVSGQAFTAPGGQLIVNHGNSSVVGGQVPLQQVSPTVLHLSTSQSSIPAGRPGFVQTGQPMVQGMTLQNRFTVINTSSTVRPSYGQTVQPVMSAANALGEQTAQQVQSQVSVSVAHRLPAASSKTTNVYSYKTASAPQQLLAYSQAQKKNMNQSSLGLTSKPQDNLRQPQLASLLSNTLLPGQNNFQAGQNSGGTVVQQQRDKVVGQAHLQQSMEADGQIVGQKRPASKQLTKGTFILQQLQKDQSLAIGPEKTPFKSSEEAVQRLLPYHVFQGSLPNEADFAKVDDEFEAVASQLLKRTQAMLNKYRLLLLEEAKRAIPSAEMVMIDRMFNQEERASLTHDKRLVLVDPDGYHADFCCASKFLEKSTDEMQSAEPSLSKTVIAVNQTKAALIQDRDGYNSSITESVDGDKPHSVPSDKKAKREKADCNKTDHHTDALLTDNPLPPGRVHGYSSDLKDTAKSTGSSLVPEVLSERLLREDRDTDNKILSNTVKCDSQLSCKNALKNKPLENPPKKELTDMDIEDISVPKQEELLKEPLETAIKSILELKKSQKPPGSEVSVNRSTELKSSNFSPSSSQESCLEKIIPDHNEGVVETDSVLEAAVNSILEC
uniref:BICRA like chromatin remodeling complex associated protein n=1 Tax=Latimeria chalumnae TaxID=7897 RepID=H3AYR3_LATCH